jgi:hypothetical protein
MKIQTTNNTNLTNGAVARTIFINSPDCGISECAKGADPFVSPSIRPTGAFVRFVLFVV